MKENNTPSAEFFSRLRDRRSGQNVDKAPSTVEYSLNERLGATASMGSSTSPAEATQVFKVEDTQVYNTNSTRVFTNLDEPRSDEIQTVPKAESEAKPEYWSETRGIHNPAIEKSVTPPPAPPLQESSLHALMRKVEAKAPTPDEQATEFLGVIDDDVPPSTSVRPRNLAVDQAETIDEYEPPETRKPAEATRRRMGKAAFISLFTFTAGAVLIVPAMGSNMTSQFIYGNKDMSMSERFEDGWNGTVDFYKGIVGLGG